MNKTIELYYKKETEFIATLEKQKKGFLVLPNDTIKELECSLENRDNEYLAKFDYLAELDNEFGRSVKEIIFRNEKDNFVLENMYLDSTDYAKAEGSINSLRSEGFNENKIQYYKAIIPLSKKISFYNVLERESYKSDFDKVIGNTITIHYKEEVFIVSSNEMDNINYLFIQSNTAQAFENFHSKTYALRIALGFVCGHFAGGKCYFFTYSNNTLNNFDSFRFYTQRDEIKNIVQPVNSNPYAWVYENKEEAEKLYNSKILKVLSKEHFSNLCKIIINNEKFRSTILLIIEASSHSLLVRPNSYCIALESLKDIVIDGLPIKSNVEKPKAPMSKLEARRLRKELIASLKKHKEISPESFYDFDTILIRIENFNQQTNIEKLRMPFKILGIELNDIDLKVIESRNDLLHGKTPDYKMNKQEKKKIKKSGAVRKRSVADMDNDLWFASNKLYTLISLLVLKFIGFDGHVINFSKKYEGQTRYIIDEPYYRNK